MILQRDDGTCDVGPLDIICILKLPAGTFHAAFFEEAPMPGPVQPIDSLTFVRLKSKMHHTGGALTLEGAQEHLDELRLKIHLPDTNVVREEAIEIADPVSVWILGNWKRSGSLAGELRTAGYLPAVAP